MNLLADVYGFRVLNENAVLDFIPLFNFVPTLTISRMSMGTYKFVKSRRNRSKTNGYYSVAVLRIRYCRINV